LSYKRTLIRLLDRPGGRFLLGKIATNFLRRKIGEGVEIVYFEGMWMRRSGPDFFPDGLKFDYRYADFNSWKRQMDVHAAETKEYWLQHYSPREGDVIVDVGAGHGEDTATFSRAVGKAGRVIAIEAHPVNFVLLKNFCRLNHLANVTPVHLALMDKPGTVRIVESESSWLENSIEFGKGTAGVPVQAGTLKDVCEQYGIKDIAFVKMNIEGAERYALLGLEPAIDRVGQICVACHDFRADRGDGEQFRTRAFAEQFLARHGFEVASRPDDPRIGIRDHIFGLRRR